MGDYQVLVDLDLLNRAIGALLDAEVNSTIMLSDHDLRLGRTTRGNKSVAESIEEEIKSLLQIAREIRAAITKDMNDD
jgi:hypothetical protein